MPAHNCNRETIGQTTTNVVRGLTSVLHSQTRERIQQFVHIGTNEPVRIDDERDRHRTNQLHAARWERERQQHKPSLYGLIGGKSVRMTWEEVGTAARRPDLALTFGGSVPVKDGGAVVTVPFGGSDSFSLVNDNRRHSSFSFNRSYAHKGHHHTTQLAGSTGQPHWTSAAATSAACPLIMEKQSAKWLRIA